jgi:hypothetical protein
VDNQNRVVANSRTEPDNKFLIIPADEQWICNTQLGLGMVLDDFLFLLERSYHIFIKLWQSADDLLLNYDDLFWSNIKNNLYIFWHFNNQFCCHKVEVIKMIWVYNICLNTAGIIPNKWSPSIVYFTF